MSDPYQPPSSNVHNAKQATLYSLQGIVVATLLGSLAAGVVILYLNYRSLGSRALAEKMAIGGIVVYLILMGIATLLPNSMLLGSVITFIQTGAAYLAARQLQGGAIAYHRQGGGAIHSNLRAAGVGLMTGLVIFFLFMVLGAALSMGTTSLN
jgi:hypothetical protein